MTKEQKIEWLANATAEELVHQFEHSSERYGIMDERYGFADPRTLEEAENINLCREELMRRLGGTK